MSIASDLDDLNTITKDTNTAFSISFFAVNLYRLANTTEDKKKNDFLFSLFALRFFFKEEKNANPYQSSNENLYSIIIPEK
jgi:hypothetical protein